MTSDIFWTVFPLWIKAFSFTLAVEIPIFWAMSRLDKQLSHRCPVWRILAAAAAGTCITHPLFWFVWPQVVTDYTGYIISGELLVATIEIFTFMLIAKPIRFRFALMASFVANTASYALGVVIRFLL